MTISLKYFESLKKIGNFQKKFKTHKNYEILYIHNIFSIFLATEFQTYIINSIAPISTSVNFMMKKHLRVKFSFLSLVHDMQLCPTKLSISSILLAHIFFVFKLFIFFQLVNY